MSYLVYCILRKTTNVMATELAGPADKPVFLISECGLSAAVSLYGPGNSIEPPSIMTYKDIVAYKNVIEAYYKGHTVIPMRYGCFFNEETFVLRFLRNNGPKYLSLLKELNGCAEMGLRLVLPASESIRERDTVRRTGTETNMKNPGKAYLEDRRLRYVRDDHLTHAMESLAEKWTEAFSGLPVKSKTEKTVPRFLFPVFGPGECVLSLFFLVPKQHVEAFRKIFERMEPLSPEKPILTGPWTPYNFVP